MYNITREQAADMLNISTRSVDRYIKAGKLRSKKDGKIVYINEQDIDNFLSPSSKQEVIINNSKTENYSTELQAPNIESDVYRIYEDLKSEISKKDEEIKELNIQIGKMEEVVKNSISMLEFKKSQFLLEESKNSIISDLENTKKDLNKKEKELKSEKKMSYILLSITIIFLILLLIVWFVKI